MSSANLEQHGGIFILNLTGDDDDRSDPNLLPSVRSALTEIKAKARVLITIADASFFSKLYDRYAEAEFWASGSKYRPPREEADTVVNLFAGLNMPSVAIITGNLMKGLSAACGFYMLRDCHDHVIIKSETGAFYVDKLNFGLTLADFLIAQKNGPAYILEIVHRRGPRKEGFDADFRNLSERQSEMGLVDTHAEFRNALFLDTVLHYIVEKEPKFVLDEAVAKLSKDVYTELCRVLGLTGGKVLPSRL